MKYLSIAVLSLFISACSDTARPPKYAGEIPPEELDVVLAELEKNAAEEPVSLLKSDAVNSPVFKQVLTEDYKCDFAQRKLLNDLGEPNNWEHRFDENGISIVTLNYLLLGKSYNIGYASHQPDVCVMNTHQYTPYQQF